MKLITKIIFVHIVLFIPLICYAEEKISSKEKTVHDKIYHFQHRVLPGWTFNTDGKFYNDLINGNHEILFDKATKIVGEEFSKKILVQKHNDIDGIVIIFPVPMEAPECYFVFITKFKDEYKFYTYEKTNDISELNVKGVVGRWNPEGEHMNLGFRKYEDVKNFISEFQENKNQ